MHNKHFVIWYIRKVFSIEVSEKQLRSEIQLGETDPEGEIRGVWHLGKEREPFASRRKLKVCKSLQKTIKHMMT